MTNKKILPFDQHASYTESSKFLPKLDDDWSWLISRFDDTLALERFFNCDFTEDYTTDELTVKIPDHPFSEHTMCRLEERTGCEISISATSTTIILRKDDIFNSGLLLDQLLRVPLSPQYLDLQAHAHLNAFGHSAESREWVSLRLDDLPLAEMSDRAMQHKTTETDMTMAYNWLSGCNTIENIFPDGFEPMNLAEEHHSFTQDMRNRFINELLTVIAEIKEEDRIITNLSHISDISHTELAAFDRRTNHDNMAALLNLLNMSDTSPLLATTVTNQNRTAQIQSRLTHLVHQQAERIAYRNALLELPDERGESSTSQASTVDIPVLTLKLPQLAKPQDAAHTQFLSSLFTKKSTPSWPFAKDYQPTHRVTYDTYDAPMTIRSLIATSRKQVTQASKNHR